MRNVVILGLATVVFAMPAPAQSGRPDPRVASAIACASISDNDQRLRCYDQAISGLTRAVEAGELVGQKTADDPKGLEGTIRSSGGRGFNLFGVTLDNGDRWEVVATTSNDPLPRPGAKVRLTKSPVGGYWFHEPGFPQRRARFLGQSI